MLDFFSMSSYVAYFLLGKDEVFKTFIAKVAIDPIRDKGFRGIRYEHSHKIQCVLLKMKSNKAYVHLRANRLLPLPSSPTIRRMLSSSECKFGFDSLALCHIGEALQGKQPHERWGSLMFDEMSITKDMKFDTRTLTWKRIVDYAGNTSVMLPNGVADHVLVFVFRPYLGSWIQPFGWFGTKGGASGVVLVETVIKSMACLFNAGAIVKNCVCDGFSSNKSMITQFGISGSKKGIDIYESSFRQFY